MATSPVGGAGSSNQTTNKHDTLNNLNLDQFLKVMITELQNQDPLNPMDNAQILQQISQMREIQATDQMRQTLESVLLGQTLVSASTMINREITGLAESGKEIAGRVESVTIENSKPMLHIGSERIPLTNIRSIQPEA
ncbi:MAG: flagellar biosynthesis protein FlgD [Pirellulales bacterium]|nr:flagellar biosynthesis protein FlgD [Pirellulales bacterium]